MILDELFFKLSTGDVIAFSGNGLDSKIIQWFTRSRYSHTIIVLETELTNSHRKDILIAESTTYTTAPDFKGYKCIKGVQIHWLSQWLDLYKTYGQAWWVPLKQTLSQENKIQMQSWLWDLYDHRVPFSFPKSVGAWLSGTKYNNNTVDKKERSQESLSFFCSELVVQALQVGGIVDLRLNPTTQTPKDVMKLTCFQEPKLIQF